MTEIEKRTGMTDDECEYWDRHIIENEVEVGPNLLKLGIKPGFANKALFLNELDKEVARKCMDKFLEDGKAGDTDFH